MAQACETGYLHDHRRMVWGKQVLCWTKTPEHALRTLLALNDRYSLDGRDCSSCANAAGPALSWASHWTAAGESI